MNDETRPIAFIMYDSRSGSTLLSALLNQYRGVSVSQETAFIPRILETVGPYNEIRDINSVIEAITSEVQFNELLMNHDAVIEKLKNNKNKLTKLRAIQIILNEYFKNRDPDAWVWVVKSPRIYFHSSELIRLFPKARFIHIIRDGRAVFNSKKGMRSVHGRKTQSNLLKAAYDWKKRLSMARKLGARQIEVRYEDLVTDAPREIDRLLDFLGIPKSDRIKTKDQHDYARSIGEKQQHLHTKVSNKPLSERIDGWQQELAPTDIMLYEILMGKTLSETGYQTIYGADRYLRSAFPILVKAVYYVFHQLYLWSSNVIFYMFVSRDITRRIQEKIIEIKNS